MPLTVPHSILVLTREHIGDLVCTTPALRSLRILYPQAHIAVEVGERAACVLENNPNLDEIVIRKDHQGAFGRLRAILTMRRAHYDLGVALDDSTHMPLTLWLAGAKYRVGLVRKHRWARFYNQFVPYDRGVHEMVDQFRRVVALLGADTSNNATEVFPGAKDEAAIDALFAHEAITPGDALVALNPGASAPSNRWPPERFAELIELLGDNKACKILLLGSLSDADAAQTIRSLTQKPYVELTGRLSVIELAVVLRRCRVLVTGDTGPMHVCAASGTPVVALFGPAIPHESGPGYTSGNVVIRKVDSCNDCTKYRCTRDNQCMKLIGAREVYDEVCTMLNSAPVSVS